MQERGAVFRLPARAQDLLLALFITVMQVQGTVTRTHGDPASVVRPLADLGHLGFVLMIVSGAVLAVRRRQPVAVFLVTVVTSVVYYFLDFPDGPGWLSLFVATYTLTAFGDGRRSLVWAGLGVAALAVCWLVAAADIEPRAALGWVFFRIGASVMSAALGESVRSRRVIAAEAVARAELAEQSRDQQTRARVGEERLRIAREVHDTVAHAIAIINVQAGMTAHVLDKRPEQARQALEAIERTSSQALREMRAVLGVLRDADDGRVPHPGLGQIGELAAKAREAGLHVDLEVAAPPCPVPVAVGGAVYRIVQESMTNVLRHAGPTRVTVQLNFGPDTVAVRVTDEGPQQQSRPREDRHQPAHGIQGMRERCRLLGGHLDAAPRAGGGFVVTARLPLAGPVTGTPDGVAAIRVLLVDDERLVRSGFRLLLDLEDDITVVGEATTGAEAVAQARAARPDVVLMDIRMPVMDGIQATRAITGAYELRQVRILILTTYDTDAYVFEGLAAGASGFLLKDAGPAELLHGIRVVAAGDALLAPRITRRLIAEFTTRRTADRAAAERLSVLTGREREVLALVGQGLSNDEIGAALFLSPATARTHVSHAMVKLGARDRAQLVVIAYQTGLVTP